MKEPFEPPAELFDQLSKDLKAEAHAIEREPRTSERAKLQLYLKKLEDFATSWLERIAPPRDQTARRQARQIFQTTIPRIVKAITAREALRPIKLPRGGVGPIVHEAGQMKPAEPDYPDRPFPETPEKLAQWKRQVARLQRVEAPRAKAAEEIQFRPYGLFERALAPERLQEAISFRPSIGWTEEQLGRHLTWRMEQLLLEYEVKIRSTIQPESPGDPNKENRAAAHAGVRTRRKQLTADERASLRAKRSAEIHNDCDPALDFLDWTAHDWANAARVDPSTVIRLLNGRRRWLQFGTRQKLYSAMKKELDKRGRMDLLMKTPRWTVDLQPVHRIPPA
jgi:hypothetical protein